MWRNFTIKAILVLSILVCTFGLFACAQKADDNNNSGDAHTHSYANYEYNNDATCVQDGTETGKCLYCNETNTRTKVNTATGNHTLEHYSAVAAGCLSQGNFEYWECTQCHFKFSDALCVTKITDIVINALGHNYSTDWTVDVEATESMVGSKSHHCTRCGDKKDITEIPIIVKAQYSVTFIDYDDSVLKTQTVSEGDSAFAPTNPTRTGYVFTGWDAEYYSINKTTQIRATYVASSDNVFVVLYSYDATKREFTISVLLSGNVNFAGYQGCLQLEVNGIELDAVNKSGLTSHGNSNIISTESGVKINFSFASAGNVKTNITILSYTFNVDNISQVGVKATLVINEICDNMENDCEFTIVTRNYNFSEEV